MSSSFAGYDVIGDVHGHAELLEKLLKGLGYTLKDGAWHHSERQALFLGDLIDRGPESVRTYRIVHAMTESGAARCLMGNHIHLVANMQIEVLSAFMKRLNGGYARYFNERHGRSGHLFESRFGSEPIKTDEQLMTAVRYVHRNPVKANMTVSCDYRWSSYREYISSPSITDTAFTLGLFNGLEAFKRSHEADVTDHFLGERDELPGVDDMQARRCMTTDEAVVLSISLLGNDAFNAIAGLPREERDKCLVILKKGGLSIRMISLVTGINRNTVWAAGRE